MLKIVSFILILYLLACLLLYLIQRNILYFPSSEIFSANAESLWLKTPQAQLKAWKINQGKPAILYFGGNAEAIEGNVDDFKKLFPGYSTYLVNYRGYGGSSGSPSEAGLFEDALSVYDQLITQHESISVIGRSLGSGVASYLAANRKVEKLVLITAYDSIKNVAQLHYPIFPVQWLLKDHYDSISYAPNIFASTLVLIAGKDQTIPNASSEKLLAALNPSTTRSRIIATATHNDISSFPEYQQSLAEFMSQP